MTQAGKGGDGGTGSRPVGRGAKGKRKNGVQLRKPCKKGWTARRKARFIEVLRATCNVQEGLRTVGMGSAGVYYQRQQDPQFAAAWDEAIEQGYAELEMHLLHQSLFGARTIETVDDGTVDGPKRTKTVHSFPHVIALRLLLAHKDKVHAYRLRQGMERPGTDALRVEIQKKLAQVRARVTGQEAADEGDDGGGRGNGGAAGEESGAK